MNGMAAGVDCRYPGIARNEDDGTRAGLGMLIADPNFRAALFHHQELLGVEVSMERNGLTWRHDLGPNVKVLRIAILQIDFDRKRPTLAQRRTRCSPSFSCTIMARAPIEAWPAGRDC